MSSLRVVSGLLCDDVRREANGKLIAIGIYANRIFVGGFPCVLNLTAFVNVSVDTKGEQRFKIRLSTGKNMLAEAEILVDPQWTGLDWYSIPFGPLGFDKPSTILMQWMPDGGKWKTFAEVPIEIGKVSG